MNKEKFKFDKRIELKAILLIIVFIIVIFLVYFINIKNKKTIKVNVNSPESISYLEASQTSEISDIMIKLKLKYHTADFKDEDFINNSFESLIGNLRILSNDNLFASKITNIIDKNNYEELEDYEKMYLDYYIRYRFFNGNTFTFTINDVKDAYIIRYPECENHILKELYIKSKDDGKYDVIRLYKINDERNIECLLYAHDVLNEISQEENYYYYCKKDNTSTAKKIDISKLNSLPTKYNELINLVNEYCEKIEYPKIKKIEEAAKDSKKEQERIKNSIPQIGMTSTQVRQCKWGNPDKINKDTYSWGTTEQWVYNKYGYVYFKNGIVSSVSER